MTTVEQELREQRSSIKVTLNAKHEPQFELKVYAGEEESELARIRTLAVEQYKFLLEELAIGRGAA